MPWKSMKSWMFDRDPYSEIPDIVLKYRPISNTAILKMFMNHGPLNYYINKYLNNFGLYYLSKEDVLKFIKSNIIGLGINYRSIFYYRRDKETELYKKLKDQCINLKGPDILFLSNYIDESVDADIYYETLGITVPKKRKLKRKKKSKIKISLDEYITNNFQIV